MTAGALADLNDEGSGGPENWLECGVRQINAEERSSFFDWNIGTAEKEFLTLNTGPQSGSQHSTFHNWVDPETGHLNQTSVGIFIPTYAVQGPIDRLASGRISYVEGIPNPISSEEGQIPPECLPEIICRPECLNVDIIYMQKSIAGLVQMHDGRTAFVLGTNITLIERFHETEHVQTDTHLFIPILFADEPPLNQRVNAIIPWLGNRILAETGQIDLAPHDVDQLFSSPDPPSTVIGFSDCHSTCLTTWQREMDTAEHDYHVNISLCMGNVRPRINNSVAREFMLMGCGTGAGIGMFCGALPGAAIGFIAGGVVGGVLGVGYDCVTPPPPPVPLCQDAGFLECARGITAAWWDRIEGIDSRYDQCFNRCLENHPIGITPIAVPEDRS